MSERPGVADATRNAVWSAWRIAGQWLALPGRNVTHDAVMAHLAEEGRFSVRFAMMTALSCAIAVLGLLLSSPAVVIGAMLLSPLMSPIILLGFALTTLDRPLVLRGLAAIGIGVVAAVALSAALVWLSPLQEITPEILARTRPNFFDLLVAVFAGIAGAYAVAQHKGEGLVGVAIATALMPPLATVGFGLATWNWPVFSGAGGLFMTNLLAIGLTASLVARVFGFGSHHPAGTTMWQALSVVAVFAVLSIPLGISLQRIASEAVQTAAIKNTVKAFYAGTASFVYGVNVTFAEHAPVHAEALVMVQKIDTGAESRLQKALHERLSEPVQLTLSQVPIRARQTVDEQAFAELTRRLNAVTDAKPPPPKPNMAEVAALQLGVSALDMSADERARKVAVHAGVLDVERLRALEARATQFERAYPGWTVTLKPDGHPLPAIEFSPGSTDLDERAHGTLVAVVWALHAAGIASVSVVGHSDLNGRSARANRAAALKRARTVADALTAAGITAVAQADFPAADQPRLEREFGHDRFRRVEIVPVAE